jgi:hypothetical protein
MPGFLDDKDDYTENSIIHPQIFCTQPQKYCMWKFILSRKYWKYHSWHNLLAEVIHYLTNRKPIPMPVAVLMQVFYTDLVGMQHAKC